LFTFVWSHVSVNRANMRCQSVNVVQMTHHIVSAQTSLSTKHCRTFGAFKWAQIFVSGIVLSSRFSSLQRPTLFYYPNYA
uniref:Secreted protein n=1 Tax=Brugia timori TaxID=42155 RepID=A0A0R3Q7I4_9BILA